MEAQTGSEAGQPSERLEVVIIHQQQEVTEGKIHQSTETQTNGPERAQPGLINGRLREYSSD